MENYDMINWGNNGVGYEFNGYKSGHALNNKLLKKLLADESAWELVSFDDELELPISFMQPITAH